MLKSVLENKAYYKEFGTSVQDVEAAAAQRGRGRGRGGRRGRGQGRVLDEPAAEEARARKQTMGKWAHRVLKIWQHWLFWLIMRISRKLSEVLDPLLLGIQKYGAFEEVERSGLHNLAVILFEKAETLQE